MKDIIDISKQESSCLESETAAVMEHEEKTWEDSERGVYMERRAELENVGCEDTRHEKASNKISTIALIVGSIFVVLAGCIFATTTWKAMSSYGKVITAVLLSGAFFGASLLTEKRMHIGRTSMTCYILGCVFLFFTVVTAGYFQMLGPVFGRGGEGWWCVFIMGSMVMSAAMAWGMRRFSGRVYVWLWKGSTLAGAFFLAVYSAAEMMERLLTWGTECLAVDVFSLSATAIVAVCSGWLGWNKKHGLARGIFHMMLAQWIHYLMLFSPFEMETQFFVMAAVMAACLWAMVRRQFWGRLYSMAGKVIYASILMVDTIVLAFLGLLDTGGILTQLQILTVVVLLGIVMQEWGKEYRILRMLMPVVLWYAVIPVAAIFEYSATGVPVMDSEILLWLTLLHTCGYAVWDMGKKDVFSYGVLAVCVIMLIYVRAEGMDNWGFAWTFLIGSYACYDTWRQKEWSVIPILAFLGLDCLAVNELASALVLEIVCLTLFFIAHKRENRRLVRVSGGFMTGVALYVMKDFWTCLAWWVYLLAAGIGLIVFAAFRERKD